MNWLTMVLLGMAIATPVLAWWILLVQWPGLAHDRYRFRLAAVRDDLVDLILAGRVQRSQVVVELLSDIETLTRTAEAQRLPRLLLHGQDGSGRASVILDGDALLAGVAPHERVDLLSITQRVREAIRDHLLEGSLTGWLLRLELRWEKMRSRKRSAADQVRMDERRGARTMWIYRADVATANAVGLWGPGRGAAHEAAGHQAP